jgi:hypothetical protein
MCAAGCGRALVPGETSAAQPGDAWVTACGQLGGLPSGSFTVGLPRHTGEAKITADVDSADLSGVTGTPTFFVNGRRYRGAYDISTRVGALRAGRRYSIARRRPECELACRSYLWQIDGNLAAVGHEYIVSKHRAAVCRRPGSGSPEGKGSR